MSVDRARPVRLADLVLFLFGVAGTALCITLVFLAMRDVLAVGGACAEGGPYEIAQPCPQGTVPATLLGIFGGLAFVGLVAWKGFALGGRFGSVVGLAWPALFGSLGWNFLEFGFGLHTLPDGTAVPGDAGLAICGVVFELMALPVAVAFLGGFLRSAPRSDRYRGPAAPAGIQAAAAALTRRPAAASPAPDEPRTAAMRELDGALRAGLAARVAGTTLGDGDDASSQDAEAAAARLEQVVADLERLASLHQAGQITDIEFAQAKARLLAAADQ